MRNNTPPQSPHLLIEEDEDGLVYVGDADEVLDDWEREANAGMDEDDEEDDEELMAGDEAAAGNHSRMPGRDDAKLTFSKHTSPVFCGALHPTEDLAVTGGEDDKAYVWNTITGEVVHEVTNHSDSVIAVDFSHDGAFVATGDMAGYIQVFKVSQNYRQVWEFTLGDMCWMRWHTAAHVLLAGAQTGEVYVWRIPSGDCKVLQGHGATCEAAELTHDGKRLAVGYGDGHFKLWDLKTNTTVMDVPPGPGSSTGIISLAVDRESQLFVTGGDGGCACIIGANGPVGKLADSSAADSTVESVLIDYPDFELKVAATGTLLGTVTIWDVARQTKRVQCSDDEPTGITRMLWLKDSTICAGTLGGQIKAWDLRSGAMRFILEGHWDAVQALVYHKEKNIILSASEDGTVKLFDIPTVE
ncbi:angio-associated migratory cell protein [Anopheles bellator]|uniref:angio-associated migratory cell protein n=1 Tax=Anopheles bellator TaxID=139047 RepID=UPI0026484C3C|nr:angio-associated migratory cell protein [Anopheles bellator]